MRFITVLVFIVGALLSTEAAEAQRSVLQSPPGQLSPKEILKDPRIQEIVRKELGLSKDSRHLNRMLTGRDSRNVSLPSGPIKVIKHLRGKNGIPFPSYEQIKSAPRENVKASPGRRERPLSNPKKILEDRNDSASLAKLVENNRLPVCSRNHTSKRITGNPKPTSGIITTEFDMLFIEPKHIPPNAREAFGANVKIRAYTEDKKFSLVPAAYGIGVRCLPTRIRVTDQHVLWSEGVPALKNYDKDPYSKGVMFESVRERIAR